jgi:hypothetical protein
MWAGNFWAKSWRQNGRSRPWPLIGQCPGRRLHVLLARLSPDFFARQHHPSIVITMFKPTPQLQRALRRLPLTTKQAGKDYYKGTRVGAMGRHTKHGGYKIDWARVRTYVVPDLTHFMVGFCITETTVIMADSTFPQLKPFVSADFEPMRRKTANMTSQDLGRRYLEEWKAVKQYNYERDMIERGYDSHFEESFDTAMSDKPMPKA